MICSKCGAKNEDNRILCEKCGAKIATEETDTVKKEDDFSFLEDAIINNMLNDLESTGANISLTEEKEEPVIEENEAEEQIIDNGKKKKNTKLIIGGVIALVLIIAIAVTAIVVNVQHSNSYSYQYKKAVAYLRDDEYEKAEKYFEKALILNKDSIDARFGLYEVYYELEDYDMCEKYLKEIIALEEENEKAYRRLIELYAKTEEKDKLKAVVEALKGTELDKLVSKYIASVPEVDNKSGTYNEPIEIELVAAEETDIIYYTLDGTDPDENSTQYEDKITLSDAGEYELRAVTMNQEGYLSEVMTEIYTISFDAPSAPSISPKAGTFRGDTEIEITASSNCTIYYTTDGSQPTQNSERYIGAFNISIGEHTISAIAVSKYGVASEVASEAYVVHCTFDAAKEKLNSYIGATSANEYTIEYYSFREISGDSYYLLTYKEVDGDNSTKADYWYGVNAITGEIKIVNMSAPDEYFIE